MRMKLTSFRLRDQVHIRDMDSVGLITPEIDERIDGTETTRFTGLAYAREPMTTDGNIKVVMMRYAYI